MHKGDELSTWAMDTQTQYSETDKTCSLVFQKETSRMGFKRTVQRQDSKFAACDFEERLTRMGSGKRDANRRMKGTMNGKSWARMTQIEFPTGVKASLAAFKREVLLSFSSLDCTVLSHFWVCSSTLQGERSLVQSSSVFILLDFFLVRIWSPSAR